MAAAWSLKTGLKLICVAALMPRYFSFSFVEQMTYTSGCSGTTQATYLSEVLDFCHKKTVVNGLPYYVKNTCDGTKVTKKFYDDKTCNGTERPNNGYYTWDATTNLACNASASTRETLRCGVVLAAGTIATVGVYNASGCADANFYSFAWVPLNRCESDSTATDTYQYTCIGSTLHKKAYSQPSCAEPQNATNSRQFTATCAPCDPSSTMYCKLFHACGVAQASPDGVSFHTSAGALVGGSTMCCPLPFVLVVWISIAIKQVLHEN